MARTGLVALLFLAVLSGCGLPAQEAAAPADPEPTVVSTSPPPEPSARGQATQRTDVAGVAPTEEEIRMLQRQLKAAGFHPGPPDGIVGPRTRSALFRLRSACANLKDLLQPSSSDILQPTAAGQTAQLDGKRNAESAEVRLVQVRLKDAGFDPGAIDGILGAKTKAALLRFQAGCTMLKNLPAAWDISIQSAGKQTPRGFTSGETSGLPSALSAKSDTAGAAKTGAATKQTGGNEKTRFEQLRLQRAGFDPGPIDGILGPKTKSAMQRYQASLRTKNSTGSSKVGLHPGH
jgi:peptidoglycan hydrolase-like protein with peptidoglycan-binding domain